MTCFSEYPKIRVADGFQLMIVPSNFHTKMASRESRTNSESGLDVLLICLPSCGNGVLQRNLYDIFIIPSRFPRCGAVHALDFPDFRPIRIKNAQIWKKSRSESKACDA
jgi:hypothetical protein